MRDRDGIESGLEMLKFLIIENSIGIEELERLQIFDSRDHVIEVFLGIRYISDKLAEALGDYFCVNKTLFLR